MNNRKTKQKEIILEVIKNNRTHPTISEICKLVTNIDSTIGQATVYRNVKKFVEDGKVHVVKTKSGIDRFDYYNDHIHFECLNCKEVFDIFDEELFILLKDKFHSTDRTVINYNLSIDGYCENCSKAGSND